MQIEDKHIYEAEQVLIHGGEFDKERRDFIKQLNSCDLLAVPGSGKTTALQAKLYCLSKTLSHKNENNGILVLSHTNSAVNEIEKKLLKTCPNLFQYPNFVGTIQDFVDSFLAIPYYNHKYQDNITRIDNTILKEEFQKAIDKKRGKSAWNWYKMKYGKQSLNYGFKITPENNKVAWDFEKNKEFVIVRDEAVPSTWKESKEDNRTIIRNNIEEIRTELMDRGILTYYDCYELAQEYLNICPKMKEILSKRFPFVFIDETQDLQEHQLKIIDQLFDNDKVCLQRIGDINQTIFSNGTTCNIFNWQPRNVMTLSKSKRLTNEIASIVNAFMIKREKGQILIGDRENPARIKPYLLIYDYENREALKTKFKEIIIENNLTETREKKYGFHIIGWNAKWSSKESFDSKRLRLNDIFPNMLFENPSTKYAKNLSEYIRNCETLTDTKQRCAIIETIICECLRISNYFDNKIFNGKNVERPFTATTLQKHLKEKTEELWKNFKLKEFEIVKNMTICDFIKVYEGIQDLVNWVFIELKISQNDDCKTFISEPYTPATHTDSTDELHIEIETIHKAKGQTHCATLYVETMYQGAYESMHLNRIKQKATKSKPELLFKNPFYNEIGDYSDTKHTTEAIKMLYVGLSRPTHLLCYAMHKTSFENYNEEKLKACGWVIIDLTI